MSESTEVIQAVVPTVVFPFVMLTAILSSLVTWIASLFGVQWKGLSVRTALGLFLKPKVLVSIVVMNATLIGGAKAYVYVRNQSRPLWWVQWQNRSPLPAGLGAAFASTRHDQTLPAVPRTEVPTSVSLAWEKQMPSGSFRGVVVSGPSLFFGGDDGSVYEVSRSDGSILRRFYIGKMATPAPQIWNGTLFAGEGDHETHHARIYAFDLLSGKLRGVIRTRGHTEGDLVIAGPAGRETLFIAAGGDGIYAADPQSLNVRWQNPIGHFDSGVIVDGERVFASTGVEKSGQGSHPALFALDFESGKELWRAELAGPGWSRPIIDGDDVCVSVGEIYRDTNYGQLACYRKETGEPSRAVNFSEALFSAPMIGETEMIVVGLKGTLCSLDRKSLRQNWCRKLEVDRKLYAAVTADDRGHLLLPLPTGLTLIDRRTGQLTETFSLKTRFPWTTSYARVAIDQNESFMIDKKGVLRKFRFE